MFCLQIAVSVTINLNSQLLFDIAPKKEFEKKVKSLHTEIVYPKMIILSLSTCPRFDGKSGEVSLSAKLFWSPNPKNSIETYFLTAKVAGDLTSQNQMIKEVYTLL